MIRNFFFIVMLFIVGSAYSQEQVVDDIKILSDGKTYSKDDLVIGIDEIRDWKIKHNLEID